MSKPNFEKLLNQGADTYDSEVGDWWIRRAEDLTHIKAYQKITHSLNPYLQENANTHLIDYACGTGALLSQISNRYPWVKTTGIDGSKNLLKRFISKYDQDAEILSIAKAWHSKKTALTATHLPNFALPKAKADIVIWCFPNIIPSEKHLDEFNDHGYQKQSWVNQAAKLSTFREMDPDDEVDFSKPADKLDEYLTQRVIHKNIASLIKPGGIFVKVEYANCHRLELSELTRMREQFIEGTLSEPIKGYTTKPFFKELSCVYHKSKVILDVFEQTGDLGDKKGGFTINFFERL